MRRWLRERNAREDAEANARLGAVMGFALVDVEHDNRTGLDYHPACAVALGISGETVSLGDLPGEKTCAGCHQAI